MVGRHRQVRPGGLDRPAAKLEHPALSLAEDAPTPRDQVKPNPQGTVKGYNPYDSGKLDKKPEPRKKDLHRLSEWLKLKKQATGNRDDD